MIEEEIAIKLLKSKKKKKKNCCIATMAERTKLSKPLEHSKAKTISTLLEPKKQRQ